MVHEKEYNGNISRDSSVENDEEGITQQNVKQEKQSQKQQQNKPDSKIEESSKIEPYITVFRKTFKGINAEHEIIYRVKLSKNLLSNN